MTEFRMPSLGADMEAGTIVEWKVHPGDHVHRGDVVAVVDTDKADIDAEIFEDGVDRRDPRRSRGEGSGRDRLGDRDAGRGRHGGARRSDGVTGLLPPRLCCRRSCGDSPSAAASTHAQFRAPARVAVSHERTWRPPYVLDRSGRIDHRGPVDSHRRTASTSKRSRVPAPEEP